MHAAGHDDLRTTMIYVNEAQVFEGGFGTPFPPLPASVIGMWDGVENISIKKDCVPRGSRTPVSDVKSRGPGPLDDGDSNSCATGS